MTCDIQSYQEKQKYTSLVIPSNESQNVTHTLPILKLKFFQILSTLKSKTSVNLLCFNNLTSIGDFIKIAILKNPQSSPVKMTCSYQRYWAVY